MNEADHFRLAGNFSSKKEFTARKRQVSVLVIWYFILRPRGKWTRGFLLMNSLFHTEPEKHLIKA